MKAFMQENMFVSEYFCWMCIVANVCKQVELLA
jgi:hypothetical protein